MCPADETEPVIARGFLNASITGLPVSLKKEVDKAIASRDKGVL
jgi:hypothetical protein